MEQLIILALVVVFYVGKNLLKKAMSGGESEESPPPDQMHRTTQAPDRTVTQAPIRGGTGGQKMGEQEEKMRKFFEALGLPTDSLPPPPVRPKAQPPPLHQPAAPPRQPRKPKREPQPPPLTTARPSYMPDAPTSVSVEIGSLSGPHIASPAEMYAATHISAPSARPVSQQDLSPAAAIAFELRSSPHTLRRAVVINELLGKPLGMR